MPHDFVQSGRCTLTVLCSTENKPVDDWPPDRQCVDAIRLLNLIKICRREKNIWKARKIHAELLKKDLITTQFHIATALITTYAKCRSIDGAREVFDQIPVHDVASWTALISAYAQNGFAEKALECFGRMHDVGIHPNAVTYICILKACGIVKSLDIGERVAVEVSKLGLLQKDAVLGTALLDMYSKCGEFAKAHEVFKQLPIQNVVSWSALISGYVQHGLGHEALKCFREMKSAGISPNAVTFICVLKACGIVGSLEMGENIYTEVRMSGLLGKDIALGNALVDMYCKCSAVGKAQEVFWGLPVRDVVSWNALISGYAQNGLADDALKCFKEMVDTGVSPDATTYACILKSCGITGYLEIGENVADEIRKKGLLQRDVVVATALVDMYSKCGLMEKARDVFDEIPIVDVVGWNALISAYIQNGHADQALECFKQMQDAGLHPDLVTYICSLKACGIMGSKEIGERIYIAARKQGLFQKEVALGNALLDMYFKCGLVNRAREVFEELPFQDVVSWNVLISGYVENSHSEEALKCFKLMQDAGSCPDAVTFVCILKASGIMGSLGIGEDVNAQLTKKGLLQKDVVLSSALVDMYSKCGVMEKAKYVFEQVPVRNVVLWSAFISGYAHFGEANIVFGLCKRMEAEGFLPNAITFAVLLSTCSHSGLVNEGEELFYAMCVLYCLTPTLEHYTCMADLFGRAGHVAKLNALLDKVPNSSHLPLFLSAMGACRKWKNVKLGRWAFEKSIKLDGNCAAAYVCMGNMCAAM